MTEPDDANAVGGIAPFGYRWLNGSLVIDHIEAPIRRLIYELFLKHRRKKSVAKLLNDLGYRTRKKALFSDTTIDRLLRDTTAKGVRTINGKETNVEPIVGAEVWDRANNILGKSKPSRQPVHLFAGIAYCECGGKMIVPSNLAKYVCPKCRDKIPIYDLEEIFSSQLGEVDIRSDDSNQASLSDCWPILTAKEKRIVIEQICESIIVGRREIKIEFGFSPHPSKTVVFGQRNQPGNETPDLQSSTEPTIPSLNEPLLSEAEAAQFLGISKMTLLRKRNARNISFYRVGFRVLYSKEKHLMPFLADCEKRI